MRSRFIASLILLIGGSAIGAAALEVAIGDASVVEGNTGDRAVDVTVVLSEPALGEVVVPYATRDGSAIAGMDYRRAAGCVTFVKGEITQKITVKVIGDTVPEPDKTFGIVLDLGGPRASPENCPAKATDKPPVSLKKCPDTPSPGSDSFTDSGLRARRAFGVLGRVQILPVVCRLSRPYVLSQMFRELTQNREFVSGMLSDHKDVVSVVRQADRMLANGSRLLDFALARFKQNPTADVYLDSPNLIAYRSVVNTSEQGQLRA